MIETSLGLWLVGVGSFAAALSTALGPPSTGAVGLVFSSPERARPERVHHAVRSTALGFIAVGGLIVGMAELPHWSVALGSLAAFGVAVWLFCAWSQYRVWAPRREQAERAAGSAALEQYPMEGRSALCARHCGTRLWALMHPFNGETWPKSFKRKYPPPE
jgi:hypothetical protein